MYAVVSQALYRSADGNRFLDTLFFALMAAQAAIYAIILDKVTEYPAIDWQLLIGGFVLASIGSGLSLLVREGPDPAKFAVAFPSNPEKLRRQCVDEYIADAQRNERLQIAKALTLALTVGLTIVPLIIATTDRAWKP